MDKLGKYIKCLKTILYFVGQITGDSPDAVRESSARSRASLRMQHRNSLNMLKAVSDERKLRSPVTPSLKSQKSFLSDAELDENGDMPFPDDIGGKKTFRGS